MKSATVILNEVKDPRSFVALRMTLCVRLLRHYFECCLAMTVLLACFTPTAHAFIADTFDAPRTEHIEKRGDFVGGAKPGAKVPFVKSQVFKDNLRGNVLEILFNVSEGFGGTYLIFRPNRIPENFNSIHFWIRGTRSAFKIEIKDSLIHSYVIPKNDRDAWQEIIIPISEFSNYKELDRKSIKEFVFVFENHRTAPRLGAIYVDDLAFEEEVKEERIAPLPNPGPVLVNGSDASGFVFNTARTDQLKLSARLLTRGELNEFRFEASADEGIHWFFLADGTPAENQKEFEHVWRIMSFPTKQYWLRAVCVSKEGNRKEGPATRIKIQNYFNFDGFLDEIERKTFGYFVDQVEPQTYFVKDRNKKDSVLSTGLSGFQWTIYVIGVEHGWMPREEAVQRINTSLDFFLNHLSRYHGLFPHWLNANREETWELGMGDAVETSYIIAGGLTAKAYFDKNNSLESSLRQKVDRLIEGVEWDTLLKRSNPKEEKGFLAWHWSLKKGASQVDIRGYNEAMITYLLALGTPYHPIPLEAWKAWKSTYQSGRYGPYELIACAPLFTHQYTHLWVDFRNWREGEVNYFENSILATFVNREYSLKENGYSPEIWGLTASEGPSGYKAYGAPPLASPVPVLNDGTVAPTAAGTSMMFTPELSMAALKDMKEKYNEKIWGAYGFKDAFNPKRNWFSEEYLGLDQAPLLIAIENYRTGLIWRLLDKDPYIQKGLERAGFQKISKEEGKINRSSPNVPIGDPLN